MSTTVADRLLERLLEWPEDHVRIEGRFLDGFPDPGGGYVVPEEVPGKGLTLRDSDLVPYRVG